MESNRYTREEVLAIFQANYIQQQQFDPEVELGEILTFETSIEEWRSICDLLPPRQIAEYFNYFFELNILVEEWITIIEPGDEKKLKVLCEFIALNATKPTIVPVKLFGADCQSAATFKYLMKRFAEKGVQVKSIKPSDFLEPFVIDNFGLLIEEVNKVNPSVLPPVNYKYNFFSNVGIISFLIGLVVLIASIWISNLSIVFVSLFAGSIMFTWIGAKLRPAKASFDGIHTFRDLVEKINENKKQYA